MNSFELSRNFFNFSFENPEKITPSHIALYFFAIEHCNRLGGKEKFGFPSGMAMEAIGIKSYNTYAKTLKDLVLWGFIKMIESSKNQYSSNIIALSKNDKALVKALDKALIKHSSKHLQSTGESIYTIDKQINNKQINNKQEREAKPQSVLDVRLFFEELGLNGKSETQAQIFWNHYTSNGWKIGGKTTMKDWKSSARNWAARIGDFSSKSETKTKADKFSHLSKLES